MVYFEISDKAVQHPGECSLKRRNAKLTEVVTYIRFVHLQHIFEKLAQGKNAHGMARDGLQVTGIFSEE